MVATPPRPAGLGLLAEGGPPGSQVVSQDRRPPAQGITSLLVSLHPGFWIKTLKSCCLLKYSGIDAEAEALILWPPEVMC